MSNRIDQLEYTVMELGSQVFRLKQELNSLNQNQSAVFEFIKNVRSVLEDKGLYDLLDFESMNSLHNFFDQLNEGEEDDKQVLSKSCLH